MWPPPPVWFFNSKKPLPVGLKNRSYSKKPASIGRPIKKSVLSTPPSTNTTGMPTGSNRADAELVLFTEMRVRPVVVPSTINRSEVEPGPPRNASTASVELPEPWNLRPLPPGVSERWSTSLGRPSTMVISPSFSNRSRPTKLVRSLLLNLVAARSVLPALLRNRSLPPPKSLVSLALNSPPASLMKVSRLPVRSTKPVISPVLLIMVLAPSVSMASPLLAEIEPLLAILVEVTL